MNNLMIGSWLLKNHTNSSKRNLLSSVAGLLLGWSLWLYPAYSSDHQDAPKLLSTPVVDISDLFAFITPEQPDRLVMIMNVFPLATESDWFAEHFEYSIVVRQAAIKGTGIEAGFSTGDKEFRFSCHFRAAKPRFGSKKLKQKGKCIGPNQISTSVRVNDEKGGKAKGTRIFAGLRSDSFFLDFRNLAEVKVGPDTKGKNSLHNKNVLSIVIESDIKNLVDQEQGSLLAIVGEIKSKGEPSLLVDRQGRSEMTNITLSFKHVDRVNQELDVRDLYNQENTFKLSPDYQATFRARFNANLAFWDKLDKQIDWQLNENGQHPLTELLMQDILVIDTAKPCTEEGFLEIEKSLLNNSSYQTCGGRTPNHDTVDSLLTLYVNAGKGPRIKDGADRPTKPATNSFPYLASPWLPSDNASE